MTFDEFCSQNQIVGRSKEEFLEFVAETLDLPENVETIPDQEESKFNELERAYFDSDDEDDTDSEYDDDPIDDSDDEEDDEDED